ncbi:MAG TPA: protein-disulfide reductase DsbD domain-containing protein [Caulobacteraceae bacterium]|nr:protein-disulfide reductase DsbD domain-containing protein [Caulobacteraceae bacterium]
METRNGILPGMIQTVFCAPARVLATALAVVCLAFASGAARAAPVKTDHLVVDLAPQTRAAAPGSTVYVALHQKITDGWHTYWRNPGDAGQATKIAWTLPAGWKAGEIVWPTPRRYATGPLMNYVYSDEVYLPVPIEVPADARPGQTATLKAHADFLVCSDICIPESADVSLELPVSAGPAALDPSFGQVISKVLAAAPKAEDLTAAYRLDGTTLKLAVTGPVVKGVDVAHAYFFPYEGSVIDHASPQMAERGPGGLTMTLVASPSFKAGGPALGVLSLGDAAYVVEARPGPLPAGASGTTPPVKVIPAPAGAKTAAEGPGAGGAAGMGLLAAIGFAFLGGLILNLMPCVFPVLSIKAAALVRHVEHPGKARAEGLAFLAGVVVTFLVLAGLLIAARAGGEAVGWGFQLQSPAVVAALCLLMLLVALNLSGVFEVGTSIQGAGSGLAQHGGIVGAFFTGALAVVVAAPCTAPFMAGAIGYAFTLPAAATLAIFAALGLGLAAPFTLIAFIPGLFGRLPKPGGWMEGLRKVLAFPMYGTAAWLAWVFTLQAGAAALPLLFAAALAIAFAAWAWGVAQRADKPAFSRVVAVLGLAAAVCLAVAGAKTTAAPAAASAVQTVRGGLAAEPWSPEKIAMLRAEGRPVFVDFTAAWCVTCQVNERTALAGKRVADAFARTGAVYLKADWTNRDAAIAKALSDQGRSGVPLYLVYGPAGEPAVLPQLLTEGMVVAALDKAKGG